MRVAQFGGLIPKVTDKSLPKGHSTIANNLDLYGNRLKPIRLPLPTGERLLTACGEVFKGKPVTVHRAGSVYVAWDKQTFTAVDWTNKLGSTTFLFVENGKLYRQSADRILHGQCPIEVGIQRPAGETVTAAPETQAGCAKTKIQPACVPVEDCDNVAHPPVPVSYLFTYLNACGEESAHSAPSEVVDLEWGDAALVTVTANNVPANAVQRRWYRTVTDNEGTARWLKIADTPIGQTQFYDMNCPCDFSCELSTETHDAPPDCLMGVANIGDNVTVIWSNKHFWLSEHNFPHAYNLFNEYKLRYQILGMYEVTPKLEGEDHYSLVAITDGLHYVIAAHDPTAVQISEIQQRYKCANPLSVCHAESELIYSSPQGICSISTSGETLLTGAVMTEVEWLDHHPEQVRLAYHDDRIYGFHKDGGFILNIGNDNRREASFVTHDVKVAFGYTDEVSPFAVFHRGDVLEWGKGDKATYDWKSQTEMLNGMWRPVAGKIISPDFQNTVPRGFRQAKMDFDEWKRKFPNGDVREYFRTRPDAQRHYARLVGGRPTVELIIYADGKEYFRKTVYSNKPFLLPRRYRAIDWAIRVIGSIDIEEIHLQSSRETLLGGD